MIVDSGEIIREVRAAPNLDSALAVLVRRIKAALPVDAVAVYLKGAEADLVLRAFETRQPHPTAQIHPNAPSGLAHLVEQRRKMVVLDDAPNHPRYTPAPETGGRHFSRFLGVPLIDDQQDLGVLVAWKQTHRPFDRSEVSFFLTIAAQLARIVHESASAEVILELLREGADEHAFIQGMRAATGIAIGTATLVDPLARLEAVPDRQAVDREAEEIRFRTAILATKAELRASEAQLVDVLPDDIRRLFEVYVMLLEDDRLVADTVERIRAGSWAPGAWRQTISAHTRMFDDMDDPYLRARGEDIRHLGTRVLGQLQSQLDDPRGYPKRCILVGDTVSVQDIAKVPLDQLAGVVSRQGSTFSHAAVLAHALGIPAVVSLSSVPVGLVDGATIAVDGDEARIYVNPSRSLLEAFEQRIQEQRALSARLTAYRDLPARTLDGVDIALYANIGLDSEIEPAASSEAAGVGLYRTEYQFLMRDAFPIEEEQYQTYRALLERFAPRPVSIRTLDVGGDKILSYFPTREDNPFLGVRGIRFSLQHPEIFAIQLRALLRANAGLGNLQILFPMLARISELDQALDLLVRAHRELQEEDQASAHPRVGALIEVPSAVFLTQAMAKRVDFLAIGTNDLAQYILAADRTNARVTTPNDSLHPAVLDAIDSVTRAAHAQGSAVHVCGEMAGDNAGALVLLGLGVDGLSMSPASFGPVKQVVRAFTTDSARAVAEQALAQEDESHVLDLLNTALQAAGLSDRPLAQRHRAGTDDAGSAGQ